MDLSAQKIPFILRNLFNLLGRYRRKSGCQEVKVFVFLLFATNKEEKELNDFTQ